MTQTLKSTWCRDRLFVKMARTKIIITPTLHTNVPTPTIKLPPVTHGCSLTLGEETGMRAIRVGLLLAALNAHTELLP